eukprot:gene6379-4584_t
MFRASQLMIFCVLSVICLLASSWTHASNNPLKVRTTIFRASQSHPSSPTTLKEVFSEVLSSQQRVINVDTRPLSIIDSPSRTLRQPYTNPDPSFVTRAADKIISDKVLIGSRSNPLHATLAGKGKGKTRFLVELEKELNTRDGVFALAITFNNKWTTIARFNKNDDMSMAVEVVLRMLTMAYGVEKFGPLRDLFTDLLSCVLSHDRQVDAAQLLRTCVECIVEDVRRSKPGCNRLVLLVDEPMYLVESGIVVGAYNSLRSVLLDEPILDDLRTSLVMTALYVDISGATDSGRTINTFSLPAKLVIDDLYNKWLPAHLPQLYNETLTDESTEPALKILVTLTASIPRATEELVNILIHAFPPDQPLRFNSSNVCDVLDEVFNRMQERYPLTFTADIMLTDNVLAYSILWNAPMKWNEDVNCVMVDGYVTNPPSVIAIGMTHTPEVSALSLCRLQDRTKILEPEHLGALYPLMKAIVGIVRNASTFTAPEKLGEPLERMGNAVISSKLLSAQRYLPKMANVGLKMAGVVADLRKFYHRPSLPDSHTRLQAHVDQLRKRTITTGDVRILNCSKSEAWDGMWMLRQKTDDQPFVLVVEYKFREIDIEHKAAGAKSTPDNRQAEYFRDTIVPACQAAVGHHDKQYADTAAAAIAAGRFTYVYIDTQYTKENDVGLVFPGNKHFLRLTGAAARRALTDVGAEVLDVVRLSSTLHQKTAARKTVLRQQPSDERSTSAPQA